MVNKPNLTKPTVRKLILDEQLVSRILRLVSEQEAFSFYRSIGEPTGENAVSLADFVKKISIVDVRSVNFHFSRKDFEKWIRDVVGDSELALGVSRIQPNLQDDALRNEIIRTVKKRLNEFKVTLP